MKKEKICWGEIQAASQPEASKPPVKNRIPTSRRGLTRLVEYGHRRSPARRPFLGLNGYCRTKMVRLYSPTISPRRVAVATWSG
jgi:hypothetical protein